MARPGISTKNTEKIPRAEMMEPQQKYPKNIEKIPKMRIWGIFGVFFRYIFGLFWV